MKALYFQHTIVLLLTPTLFLFAQVKTETTSIAPISAESLNPFAKGKWEYLVKKIGEYENVKNYGDPEITGHQNKLGIDLGTTYFFANGFGAGVDLSGDWKGVHNGSDITTNKYMGCVDFTYGKVITNNFDFYARAGIGYGMINTKEGTGANSSTVKDNEFEIKGELGFPIRLGEGNNVFLTPGLGYNYRSTTFNGGKEIKNGFQFCLGLETYLGCDEMMCDCRHGFGLSRPRYQQGNSIIGFSTDGDFRFGNIKDTYTGASPGTQIDYTRGGLGFEYDYYLLHNVFIGAESRFKNEVQKIKGTDNNKVTMGSWDAGPLLGFNVPVQGGWNNITISGGVKWGSDKTESTSGTNTSTQKINTTNYCVKFGYNDFFTPHLSLTPSVEYDWNCNKLSGSSQMLKTRGFGARLGIQYYF